MNYSKYILVCVSVLISVTASRAEEGSEGGEQKSRVGPGKAVLEASEKTGLRLSDKAIRSFALTFKEVTSAEVSVPISALVRFQDFVAVYRKRDGWFRMVEIEPVIQGGLARFSSKDLVPGDQVVSANGGLIRVVELDVFGPEADACVD